MIVMNNYLFKCFCFLFTTFAVICDGVENDEKMEGLPYCGPPHYAHYKSKKLVFVSTLDGHVSMLNIADGGVKEWSVPTGPGPLLSSNIHKLELTNNGQWIRMIPSLNGGLYKFNGEFIEAIPINAEHLLKSSFRYSDDLVISGGKESRSYGVDVLSGRVLYECNMQSCENVTDYEVDDIGDIVVIQRLTQTVRAVETRTGTERWNFSVGQHDVKFSPDPTADCHILPDPESEIVLKVIVPEGLICALSKSQPGKLLWSHKFESPVVSAWRLDKGQLELVDLFGGKTPLVSDSSENVDNSSERKDEDYADYRDADDILPDSPALYVGMHKKQLYIQESVTMQSMLHKVAVQYKQHLIGPEKAYPRIPWQPVSATALALSNTGRKKTEFKEVLQITDESSASASSSLSSSNDLVTATSVLYGSEYVNGKGYFLYSEKTVEKSKSGLCHSSNNKNGTFNVTVNDNNNQIVLQDIDDAGNDNVTSEQVIKSLWYWWKEVCVISISTAVVFNLFLQRRHLFLSSSTALLPVTSSSISLADGGDSGVSSGERSVFIHRPESYSRFTSDFDTIQCLGKGGFGIVFEVKNKLDDCRYAIKRIPLRQESKDRVMREVKALANLEHKNIVRYFQAWLEKPSPDWHEALDKFCVDRSMEFDDTTTVNSTDNFSNGVSCHSRNRSYNLFAKSVLQTRRLDEDDDDSFIKFEKPPDCSNEDNQGFGIDSHEPSQIDNCVLNVDDNSEGCKERVIDMDSVFSSKSNSTTTSSISENNNDCGNKKKVKQNHKKHKRLKRPDSLPVKTEELDSKSKVDIKSNCDRMYLFIQMQLCRKESLREWLLSNNGERKRHEVLSMFKQIVQAVEYLHLKNLIHRDLKPSNIFFSLDGEIKVGDFGLVTAMAESGDSASSPQCTTPDNNSQTTFGLKRNERHTARVGTDLYMSPEQVQGKRYSYKVDIYSLGLILFELLIPFNTQSERWDVLRNLRKNLFPKDFQENFNKEYELLSLMLSHNPNSRPTTIGIRARPPLSEEVDLMDVSRHFELPTRRKTSSNSSSVEN